MTAAADLYTMLKSMTYRQVYTLVSRVLAAAVWHDHLFLHICNNHLYLHICSASCNNISLVLCAELQQLHSSCCSIAEMPPCSQFSASSHAPAEAACVHAPHTATFSHEAFQQYQQSDRAG